MRWPRKYLYSRSIRNASAGGVINIARWTICDAAMDQAELSTLLNCWAKIGTNMAIGELKFLKTIRAARPIKQMTEALCHSGSLGLLDSQFLNMK